MRKSLGEIEENGDGEGGWWGGGTDGQDRCKQSLGGGDCGFVVTTGK